MNEVDPVQFGKLIQSVETLTEAVMQNTKQIVDLEKRMSYGKGALAALIVVAGGVGAASRSVIEHLFLGGR